MWIPHIKFRSARHVPTHLPDRGFWALFAYEASAAPLRSAYPARFHPWFPLLRARARARRRFLPRQVHARLFPPRARICIVPPLFSSSKITLLSVRICGTPRDSSFARAGKTPLDASGKMKGSVIFGAISIGFRLHPCSPLYV